MNNNLDKKKIIDDLLEIQRKKDSIRKTYSETKEKIKRLEKKRRRIRRIFISSGISAAACIAVLVIIFIPSIHKLSEEEIFEKYYQKYEFNYETRSGEANSGLIEAYRLYIDGSLDESMKKLELVYTDQNDPEFIFYRSLIFLDQEDYEKAYDGFTSLIELGGTYKWHSLWYCALIDIRNEDYSRARSNLKMLNELPKSSELPNAGKVYRMID